VQGNTQDARPMTEELRVQVADNVVHWYLQGPRRDADLKALVNSLNHLCSAETWGAAWLKD
jgi:hypothetical protein